MKRYFINADAMVKHEYLAPKVMLVKLKHESLLQTGSEEQGEIKPEEIPEEEEENWAKRSSHKLLE